MCHWSTVKSGPHFYIESLIQNSLHFPWLSPLNGKGDDGLRESLGDKDLLLCRYCQKLLNHGIARLLMCPYAPADV